MTLKFILAVSWAMSLCCGAATEVRYSDFGAKGDGKTDDFEALRKAHAHANAKGLPVRADDGKTYYIGGADMSISIMTDTDFGTATFIIDDTKIENPSRDVFDIKSGLKRVELENIHSLKKGQNRLDVKLPSACLVLASNDKVKRFIRRGGNQNNGSDQTDVFVVDATGKVDVNTPIIWDFDHISSITALPIDEKKLTVKGGKFITIASVQSDSRYHRRGFRLTRSNVLIDGVVHQIKGEGKEGPPYSGFFTISNCANVELRDVKLSGHKFYSYKGSAGKMMKKGTYDLNLNKVVNVSLIRCTQLNSIMDKNLWGIMGSNLCKNLLLDGCELSRFDAHQGVTNGTIRNSTLGYKGIRLIGFGTFLVENTTVKAREFISLRSDYGSTWNGDVTIRNCKLEPNQGGPLSIFSGSNDGQHDFGYTTYLPQKVIIDKLHIADARQGKAYGGPVIFGDINPKLKENSKKAPYPQVITKFIAYRGVTTDSGKPLVVSSNQYMFRDVKVHQGK